MTSMKSSSPNHSLVVAVKEHLAKVVSHHTFNSTLEGQMNDAQNSTFPRIWKLIQTPISLEEIYHSILKDTHIDCQPCEQDILSLIQMFARLGLVDIRIEIKSA